MSRLGLIIQREYLQTVGKKSFILTTILVPVLSILLCVVLPIMLAEVHSDDLKTVAIIDQTADQSYAPMLQDTEDYHFVPVANYSDVDPHTFYTESNDEYYAVVQLPADIDTTLRLNVYSEQSVPTSLGRDIERMLRPALRQSRIASYNIDSLEHIIQDCDVNLHVNSVKWGADGEENISSSELSSIFGLMLSLAIYMFVMVYGAMIMSGVVEEKTNRIVEVIVSSCKPLELMLGKIIGVALVGFTQFAIWAVLIGVGGSILTSMFGVNTAVDPAAIAASQGVDPSLVPSDSSFLTELFQMLASVDFGMIFGCFILYFIGGYLLYASLFAAFGSAVDQQQDTSQFMGPIMFFMVFALYAGMFSMENPDGPLAWWCSMIPFTSPITMMVRLPFDVPVWEIALSLGVLYATAFLILWLAARIYRIGILMYSKKFNWKDIVRWIRQ